MNIYIGEPVVISDMQWPAPDGFHIPLISEFSWLKTIMDWLGLTTWNNWKINLHMPFAGYRDYSTADLKNQGSYGLYWSSSPDSSSSANAYNLRIGSGTVYTEYWNYRALGLSVRCFKNSYVEPTSSWTVINGTLWWAWIFWNQTEWLISITSDWTTWYTIQDKNLWATTVYNNWNTLTQDNMWNMYQRWNNYWFPSTWSVTTSSTRVNASSYWPWNYYTGSTFITTGSSPYNWSNPANNNLRWWVSQWTSTKSVEVKNIYIGEYGWKPWSNTLWYRPFKEDILDHSWNNHNFSITRGTTTFSDNACTFNTLRCTDILFSNYSWDMTILAYVLSATSTASFWWASAADWAPIWKFFENNYGIYSNWWYYVDWNWITYPDLYVAVKSWTNVTLYKGWSVNATWTTLLTVPANNTWIYVWWYRNNNETMKVWNLIVENRAWTADEIQFYYNMTKKDYWIS